MQNYSHFNLNPEQREAVETTQGPVLVLAGAGTGKTRVLTTRLVHILASESVFPWQILAVTFTNKAANEMRDRIMKIAGRSIEGGWLGTFHSLAVRIVRRHGECLGIRPSFTILDSDDQHRLLKQILKDLNIDDKKNPPRLVASVINRWKDRGLTATKMTRSEIAGNILFSEVYKEYQKRLLTLNAVDFGDLILHCLTLFTDFPEILESYQKQFKYIMVDEYQDTNVAQYLWLRMLTMTNHNICCVGDDDQSIYAWRGAEVGNILRFEQDFPGAKVIRLEQNYRSTPYILGAASGLIYHNTSRLGKKLWTEDISGDKILVRGTWDCHEEAYFVGKEIENRHRYGELLSNIAILVRAGFQTREFEDRLLAMGIPYRVLGGLRFYERQEIRDALAYLRLVVQPDDGLAFERIINVPRRGIGQVTLQLIHKEALAAGSSLSKTAFELCETDVMGKNVRSTLYDFFTKIDRWRQLLLEENHAKVSQLILDESGYTQMWREEKSPDAPGRLENLKELITAIKGFDSLSDFLEHVSLVMEKSNQSHEQMINIMTLHAAKGLEFDVVFLPGWEEGLFPHARCLDDLGLAGLEEERRLAYVGITRAKKEAIITYALKRRSYQGWQSARPSRFVEELPETYITHIQPSSFQTKRSQERGSVSLKRLFSENSFRLKSPSSTPESSSFREGDQVFHQKFGYGIIQSVHQDHLDIKFKDSSYKTVMTGFVEKA